MTNDSTNIFIAWLITFLLAGVAYNFFSRTFIGRLIIGAIKTLWKILLVSFGLLTNIFKCAYNQTEKLCLSLEDKLPLNKTTKSKVLYIKDYRKRK